MPLSRTAGSLNRGFGTIQCCLGLAGELSFCDLTPKDMLAGHQQEIQAERDRKLEAAREHRKNCRQRAA